MFNTLKYANILEEVGFTKDQAETSITLLAEIMEDKLATKQDFKDLESRLTIRMGTMLAATIAILATIQKIL